MPVVWQRFPLRKKQLGLQIMDFCSRCGRDALVAREEMRRGRRIYFCGALTDLCTTSEIHRRSGKAQNEFEIKTKIRLTLSRVFK